MPDLQSLSAKICYTAAGNVIHEGKTLLVKHKKLGFWLCPGGHIDEGELPHQAAERECWEETGVKAKAIFTGFNFKNKESEYLPTSLLTNLHWVCQENYQKRMQDPENFKPQAPWKKGCEQHLGFYYLLEPVGSTKYKQNTEETDGIAWFTPAEVAELETPDTIKAEIEYAFKVWQGLQL